MLRNHWRYRTVSSALKSPVTSCLVIPYPYPQNRETTDLFFVFTVPPFPECPHDNPLDFRISGTIQYVAFWTWLLAFVTVHLTSFCLGCVNSSCLATAQHDPDCLSIHPPSTVHCFHLGGRESKIRQMSTFTYSFNVNVCISPAWLPRSGIPES